MTGAVSAIFDLSDRILNSFSSIFDKFLMPLNQLFPVLEGSWVEKAYNKVFETVGFDFNFSNSIIDFILGPGLIFIIYYTLIKWVLDIVL